MACRRPICARTGRTRVAGHAQIGADYVRVSRDAITPLIAAAPSVTLLPWSLSRGRTENDYNRYVAARSGGRLLCLDRSQTVRNPLGIGSSLEICDLLGPENELIHVKRAKGSTPLSHLFSQGLSSAQSLIAGPAVVREQFIESVASVPRGSVRRGRSTSAVGSMPILLVLRAIA